MNKKQKILLRRRKLKKNKVMRFNEKAEPKLLKIVKSTK